MLVDFLIIVAGVTGILFLAEIVIRNAVELAHYLGLSGSFIGLTVLSVGTSMPEIMSYVVGSLEILNHPETMAPISGLLIGTNIGSDIFQQNFILPVVGLIGTVVVVRSRLHDVMGGLLGAALLAWIFCLGGFISRSQGAVLMLAYAGYLIHMLKRDVRVAQLPARTSKGSRAAWLSSLFNSGLLRDHGRCDRTCSDGLHGVGVAASHQRILLRGDLSRRRDFSA